LKRQREVWEVGVKWTLAWESMQQGELVGWFVSELEDWCSSVLVNCCFEKLIAEAWGELGNSEEGKLPPLEAATERRQEQTEKT
jgi:hypothetical protein